MDDEWNPDEDWCPTGIGVFGAVLLSIVLFWVPVGFAVVYLLRKG